MTTVIGGKLSLKGGVPAVPGIRKKKRKKRKSVAALNADSSAARRAGRAPTAVEAGGDAAQPPVHESSEIDEVAGMTAAERAFAKSSAKREAERIRELASKTHRQRIEEMNKYLGELSEHYDIPKVGPG